MGNRFLDHNFQQRIQDENKHDEKDTSQKKIILDKKDNTAQQNGEVKKKKQIQKKHLKIVQESKLKIQE